MKIVVVGGRGLIGRKLVTLLRERTQEVVVASRSSGIDVITGEGLSAALSGADVVVDVSNSPSFEDAAVLTFFETSTRNLLAAEKIAGVGHHVALSVVGADRNPESGYMRAKVTQEALIQGSGVPYTILRATQFFEFAGAIAESGSDGTTVHLPPALMQPVAADDVAATLADVAVTEPLRGTIELAGPEPIRMDEFVRRYFAAIQDPRLVQTDAEASYFGAVPDDRSLTPAAKPRLGRIRFEDWLARQSHRHEAESR